jgi:ribosomal protein S12 methylthiotransferase
MAVQREISRELGEKHIGQTLEVMVDRVAENSSHNFEARTQWDAPEIDGKVMIERGDAVPGRLTRVRIVDADAYDLYAAGAD